uniref:Uncharacterized protein n=1 Tax=Cucumis melo TaxID=3656 RepID=A0A9I9CQQ5_CUCME
MKVNSTSLRMRRNYNLELRLSPTYSSAAAATASVSGNPSPPLTAALKANNLPSSTTAGSASVTLRSFRQEQF